MVDTILNFITSPLAPWIIGFWVLALVGWKSKREAFIHRMADLVNKPSIYDKDNAHSSVSFYPRTQLESWAQSIRSALGSFLTGLMSTFDGVTKRITSGLSVPNRPRRIRGYAIFSVLFIAFLFADTTVLVGSLEAFGYQIDVPEVFTRFEIALTMGSIFSAVTAGLLLFEMKGDRSDFTDWDEAGRGLRTLAQWIVWGLLISSVVVVLLFGVRRLVELGRMPDLAGTWRGFAEFGELVLIPANVVTATFIIAREGLFHGVLVWIAAASGLAYWVLYLVNKVSSFLGSILPVILDWLIRIEHVVVSLLLYVVFTPLELLTEPVRRLASRDLSED